MAKRNPFGTTSSCGCGGGSTATQSVCETRRIKSISRVKDEVIIAFDDCSYMRAPVDVVDASLLDKLNESVSAELNGLKDKLATLESGFNKLLENVIEAKNAFGADVPFKVISKDYQP